MARALQCPDCGHREPIDNVIDVDEFRCQGCGRALKVPPQVKPVGVGAAAAAPPVATRAPELDPRPAPSSLDSSSSGPTSSVPSASGAPDAEFAGVATAPPVDAQTRVLARAQTEGGEIDGTAPGDDAVLPRARRGRRALPPVQAVVLPRVLRLVIWAVMLPVGLGGTFFAALRTDWLSRDDLLGTIGEADWSRFVPIAWLMPVAAIIVALLVHCTVIVLEQLVARRRLRRATTNGASTASPGTT